MAFSRGRSVEVVIVEACLLVLTAAAFAASLNPTVEFWFNTVAFGLLGAGALWLMAALIHRELRIRRRLAAIRNEPAPTRHTDTRNRRTSHPADRKDAA
jgi:ABC-type nickel/cobalt efflux system permease component RcnA